MVVHPRVSDDTESTATDTERPHRDLMPMSQEGHLKSRVIKRSLVFGGHKTSVSLEDVFWNALRQIAHDRKIHLSQLVGSIDSERQHCNLSSAIRLFVFDEVCKAAKTSHSDDEPASRDFQPLHSR